MKCVAYGEILHLCVSITARLLYAELYPSQLNDAGVEQTGPVGAGSVTEGLFSPFLCVAHVAHVC